MIIVIELCFLTVIVVRTAVGAIAGRSLTAPLVVFGRPIKVVSHDQVKPSILIEVNPSGTCRPLAFIRNTSFRRYIAKGPIAVVVIKDGTAIASDVQIGIPVIVEIA